MDKPFLMTGHYAFNIPNLEPLARGTMNAAFRTCVPNECSKKGSGRCIYAICMYYILLIGCHVQEPLIALYLILGKRIGDSVSGGIGDSVSVFSSMAALFAWQLPVFDRGKSHVKRCSAAPEHLHLHRPMERQTPNWNRSCLSLKRNLNLFPCHPHLAQLAELVV